MCNATCPTYQLLGDELDGPRGRIYLIKDMLENNKPPNAKIVKHIDRCLSCYSCMTTCPSGVNYMHLIDHGRSHIEKTYKRPFNERFIRDFLSRVISNSFYFRIIGIHKYVNEGGGSFNDDGDIHVPFSTFKRIYNTGDGVGFLLIAGFDDVNILEVLYPSPYLNHLISNLL